VVGADGAAFEIHIGLPGFGEDIQFVIPQLSDLRMGQFLVSYFRENAWE
jgi:hypothetical protein